MRSLKIFIIDDNQDFAESLDEILTDWGHQVELAFDGETAIRRFKERDFDLTFMDVKLPGKNGVESFFEIRRLKPQAQVIMMTGYSVEQLLMQAIEHGALGVLHKPIDINGLRELLERVKPDGIILADDDQDFVDSVLSLLIDNGYTVFVARTGREAVEQILANQDIHILVLDLRLPILSGLEVYLTLKQHNRVLPTVIVTGYAIEEANAIAQLRSMSVTGCLIKPFDPEDLLQAIRSIENQK